MAFGRGSTTVPSSTIASSLDFGRVSPGGGGGGEARARLDSRKGTESRLNMLARHLTGENSAHERVVARHGPTPLPVGGVRYGSRAGASRGARSRGGDDGRSSTTSGRGHAPTLPDRRRRNPAGAAPGRGRRARPFAAIPTPGARASRRAVLAGRRVRRSDSRRCRAVDPAGAGAAGGGGGAPPRSAR